jgi:superfamily II DNA or RNA helicase
MKMDVFQFRSRFKKLTKVEQILLKLLALAYEPLNAEELTHLAKTSEIPDFTGNSWQQRVVLKNIELLLDGGWVVDSQEELNIKPMYLELLTRMAVVDPGYSRIVSAIKKLRPYKNSNTGLPINLSRSIREIRFALYAGNTELFYELEAETHHRFKDSWLLRNFLSEFFQPFDASWLRTFPVDIQAMALEYLLSDACVNLRANQELLNFSETLPEQVRTSSSLRQTLFLLFFLKGDGRSCQWVSSFEKGESAWISPGLLQQFYTIEYRDKMAKIANVESEIKEPSSNITKNQGFAAVLQQLFELSKNTSEAFEQVTSYPNLKRSREFLPVIGYIHAVAHFQLNNYDKSSMLMNWHAVTELEKLFYAVCTWWNEGEFFSPDLDRVQRSFQNALDNNYYWVALQYAALLTQIYSEEGLKTRYSKLTKELVQKTKSVPVVGFLKKTQPWQRCLSALSKVRQPEKTELRDVKKISRLVWWVDLANHKALPVEQVYGTNGWSKGRAISLTRLKEQGIDGMSKQDIEAVKALKTDFSEGEWYFDYNALWPELVGHPLLFLIDNPSVSVELIEKMPQLLVEKVDTGYALAFSPAFTASGIQLHRETPTRYQLMNISEEMMKINNHLGFGKMVVPEDGKQLLVETLGKLSSTVIVQSDLDKTSRDMPVLEGNCTPCIHLLPIGDGFKLEFFVKPFTTAPPYLKPGTGRENIIAEIEGISTRAVRNLNLELQLVERVLEQCPSLQPAREHLEWSFGEAESCLQVLLELEPLKRSGDIFLEYPRGEKLRISGRVDFSAMKINIRKNRDWFELDGTIQLNENLVMGFTKFLELVSKNDSRFIEIKEGQFLALTSQFRKKLQELHNILHQSKEHLKIHPLAVHAFEEIADQVKDLETDIHWKQHLARIKTLDDFQSEIPSGFMAELRDYQLEGYTWLCKMANWGVGACLADDMGLGKTVQALALILSRASKGPALVVAPASVVSNWQAEAQRFAPSLNPIVLREGDRIQTIKALNSGDLLLCSYGMLQQEQESLVTMEFSTIVLDEAQAIKNRNTKRSHAAMSLKGEFKMVTTGTPIENHLGELWNLFHFLTPGLLGPIDRFNEKFAFPIERYHDRECKEQLKRLLQPFILRRKKKEVLHELPEKTEITLSVSFSVEERAFYEVLRREALERINNDSAGQSQRRFRILAELMRLRQACCHPRIVLPSSNLASSKLALFAETVEELLEEGHKALVFSQFVTHLKLIEEWVKEKAIPYQYIDGSTPITARDKAIQAFQSGNGDIFLISLKAGGFGLNLTAADYVIHLDPWWNPAVEDQASDRSHRIGQEKPVTIYRLITEGTIEEKILQLHAEKRELADSLLEGADSGARLTAEEMLALLRD